MKTKLVKISLAAPKAKRNRLDSMIASGKTPTERKRILAMQRVKPIVGESRTLWTHGE